MTGRICPFDEKLCDWPSWCQDCPREPLNREELEFVQEALSGQRVAWDNPDSGSKADVVVRRVE